MRKRKNIRASSLAQITPLSPTWPRAWARGRCIRIKKDPCLYLYATFTCFPLSWNSNKWLIIPVTAIPFFLHPHLPGNDSLCGTGKTVGIWYLWEEQLSVKGSRANPPSYKREGSGNFHGCSWVPSVLSENPLPLIPGSPHNGFLMHRSAFDDYCQIIFLIWLRKDLTGSVS